MQVYIYIYERSVLTIHAHIYIYHYTHAMLNIYLYILHYVYAILYILYYCIYGIDSMVISLGVSLLKVPYRFTQWELTFAKYDEA